MHGFDDILAANAAYAQSFRHGGLEAQAAQGLAVLTCIDSRIEPLVMLGLEPGDAKIIRNAGARVTDDALRSLVLATNLLGVTRVMIVIHTECAMHAGETELQQRVAERHGLRAPLDTPLHGTDEPLKTLALDLERVRTCSLIPAGTEVEGFEYDVRSGRLRTLQLG